VFTQRFEFFGIAADTIDIIDTNSRFKRKSNIMELTEKQFEKIKHLLPVPRGNMEISHRDFINALLYVAENGCKWRRLPKDLGYWHAIYMRMRRWAEKGILDRIFQELQEELLVELDLSKLSLSLDSTFAKVHPDGTGPLKKTARKPPAKPTAATTRKSTSSSPTRPRRSP